MSVAAIIYLALIVIGLFLALVRDGEPDKVNFFASLVGALITVGLLYWGDFFDPETDEVACAQAVESLVESQVQVVVPDGYELVKVDSE